MRKLISIVVITIILLSFVGCSTVNPEETVKEFFTAAQKLDLDSMAATIVPSNIEDIEETTSIMDEEEDDYTKYFLDYLKTNAGKIIYKITGSEIKEDKAVVTVDCKYIDGGPLLRATIGEVFSRSMGMAFSGVEMTEEYMDEMFINSMKEQKTTIGETFTEATIKINCVKEEDAWYIEEISDELFDVVTSGFVTTAEEIVDSFEDGEESKDRNISKDNPTDALMDINNYVVGDLWNKGFCEISWYLEYGTGSTGQEIDIDFTKSQLDKAMEKKAGYDEYIAGLDSNYADIKEVWNKMSLQIDSMYEQVQSGASSLNTDLYNQYHDAFSDLIHDLSKKN